MFGSLLFTSSSDYTIVSLMFSVYMVLEYVTKMAESFAEKAKCGVLKVIMFTPSSANTKQLDGRTHHGKDSVVSGLESFY